MITAQNILEALQEISSDFVARDNPLDAINGRLRHHGFDPEGVAACAQYVMVMSAASNETPEAAVQGAFTMGVILGAMLGENSKIWTP